MKTVFVVFYHEWNGNEYTKVVDSVFADKKAAYDYSDECQKPYRVCDMQFNVEEVKFVEA